MIDFKKSIFYGYNGIKWYYLLFIFVLIIIYSISNALQSSTIALVSLSLLLIIVGGVIGTKIYGKLKNIKTSYKLILKNSGIYLLMSFIYLLIEIAVIVLGVLLISVFITANIGELTDLNLESIIYSSSSGTLATILLLFLLFGFIVMILEFMKVIGMVRSFKTNKFSENFMISKNFKAIFTKDYFTILMFCLGYGVLGIAIVGYLWIIASLFNETASSIIANLLVSILIYTITCSYYSLIADYQQDKK